MSSINLLDLPFEILEKICYNVKDLKDLSLVCKDFYKFACKIQEKNIEVKFDDDDLFLTKEKLTEIISSSKGISLDIYLEADKLSENLMKFLEDFSDKIFIVKFYGSIFEADFYKLIKYIKCHQCLNLYELKIVKREEDEKFDDAEDFIENITKLEIHIAECTRTRDWSERTKSLAEFKLRLFHFGNTKNFIKKLKNLKVLRIHDRLDYSEMKLSEIFKGKELEELELTHLRTIAHNDEIFKAILSQRNLKVLKIHNFSLWNEFFEEITEKLTNLTTFEANLWLISCFIIRDIDKLKNLVNLEVKVKNFDQLVEIPKLKLKNLKNLKIHHHNLEVDQNVVKNIAKNFPNLTSIGFCGNLFSSLDSIFTNFNSIENLHIYNQNTQKYFKDRKFFEKSHKNENLKNLFFNVKTTFDEQLVEKISKDFPNLEILTIDPSITSPACSDVHNLQFQYMGKDNLFDSTSDYNSDAEEKQDLVIDNFEDYVDYAEVVERKNFNKSQNFEFAIGNFDSKIKEKMKDEKLEKFVTFNLDSIEKFYNNSSKLKTFLNTERIIRNLKISFYRSIDEETYSKFLTLLKTFGDDIQTLTIGQFENNKKSLFEILNMMPNIENLIIHSFNLSENDSGEIHLKNLKYLNIRRCRIEILNHIKIPDNKLEKLILRPRENFLDLQEMNTNLLENQKNVKILDLQIDANYLKTIKNFLENSQFEELTYAVSNIEDTDDFANFLKNQKNLKRLKIDCTEILTNEHFEAIQSLNLTSLRLENFDGIDERELREILKLKELKQLSLKANDGNEEIFGIFNEFSLPKLEEFYLNESEVIFDYIYYERISNCMPNLKSFIILDSGFYEDEIKYAEIFNNFNKVEILSLNNSSLPRIIFELDGIKNENLKELKISQLYHYEIFEFQKIVENFPNLEKISFEFTVQKCENQKELKKFILEKYQCLLSGLKNLKLFNCSTAHANNLMSISFNSKDFKDLLKEAKNLEFFASKNTKIENFEEIKRIFGPRFDYVKSVDDILLFCNRRILNIIKKRVNYEMWILHDVINLLGEFFFKSFDYNYFN